MRVSALKPSPRRPGFVTVFLDGVRVGVLPVERVRALGLTVGLELDEAGDERLEQAAAAEDAYRAAVRLLAARGRSSQEIIERLRWKGMGKDAIAYAVGRLGSEGVLDDAAFARAFARSRAQRGYGPARVLSELSRKGVERRVAELAVRGEVEGGEGEVAGRIEAISRKRAGQMSGLSADVRRRRLTAYLLRRGFRGAEVQVALKKVLKMTAPESDEPA